MDEHGLNYLVGHVSGVASAINEASGWEHVHTVGTWVLLGLILWRIW